MLLSIFNLYEAPVLKHLISYEFCHSFPKGGGGLRMTNLSFLYLSFSGGGGRGWPKDARCHSFYRLFFKASLSLIQTRYFLLFLFTFIEGVGLSYPYIPVICNLIIDVKLEACWRKGFTRLAGNPQPGIFHFESELLWFNQKFTLISITFIYIYMSSIVNLDKAEDAAKSKLYL